MKKFKSLLFFICLVFLCLVITKAKSVKHDSEKTQPKITFKDDGSFLFEKHICDELGGFNNVAVSIKASVLDLSTSFKKHVDKYNSNLHPSLKKSSIQMQIVSAYLDEINKIAHVIKELKSNLKDFRKNGCELISTYNKSVSSSDKLLSKLIRIIKKHVKRIESPFQDLTIEKPSKTHITHLKTIKEPNKLR